MILNKEFIFISQAMGFTKRDEKIFLAACKVANLAPSQCAYVGDHPAEDVELASTAGFFAIHFQREGVEHAEAPSEVLPHEIIYSLTELKDIFKGVPKHG